MPTIAEALGIMMDNLHGKPNYVYMTGCLHAPRSLEGILSNLPCRLLVILGTLGGL